MLSASGLEWGVFVALVLAALGLDAALFGRSSHVMRFREAALRSAMFVSVAALFAVFVFLYHHPVPPVGRGTPGVDFAIAYLVEQSLSIDNLFVFLVIFSYFRVPQGHQQRVLFWGIVGAVLMRGVFVVAGAALLHSFKWMIYPFGAFLAYTGLKLGLKGDDDETVDPGHSPVLRIARSYLRTSKDFEGDRFFVVKDGLRYATPLFLVLLVVEFTDVLFAVDSVPAVLAITDDLYVVYTSNIFAILGLRALYFLLAGMMSRFRYLDVGVSFVLVFIGVKMMLPERFQPSNLVSLGVIAGTLVVAVTVSLLRPPPTEES